MGYFEKYCVIDVLRNITNGTKKLMAYILLQLDKLFIFYLSFVDSMQQLHDLHKQQRECSENATSGNI